MQPVFDKPMKMHKPLTGTGYTHTVSVEGVGDVKVVVDSDMYSYVNFMFPELDLQTFAFSLKQVENRNWILYLEREPEIPLWSYKSLPNWARRQ